MTAVLNLFAPLGRLLLVVIFVFSGFGKLSSPGDMIPMLEAAGLPGFLIYVAGLFEIIGGLMVLLGWFSRVAAVLLAGFCLLTGYMFHFVPAQGLQGMEQMIQMIMFFKNVALAGAFLTIVANGPGAYAMNRN